MLDAPSQTDRVLLLLSSAERWEVIWTAVMVCLELHLPISPTRQLFLNSPFTSWDSSSRRGSAAARWPRRRRRWRWRTKFCFPANPGLTKGQCIPSFPKSHWSFTGWNSVHLHLHALFAGGQRGVSAGFPLSNPRTRCAIVWPPLPLPCPFFFFGC